MRPEASLFKSFFQAGFECSTHKHTGGKRLDLICSTLHDRFAHQDYRRIQEFGISTIRIAARWHLIEACPRRYGFESLAVLLDAAAETNTEVLLDLLHFGWPEHVDVFSLEFPAQFAEFAFALTRFLKRGHYACRMFAPVNEISFLSWAGGDKGSINPYAQGRGHELKRNLIRAAAEASEVLLGEVPGVRLMSPEPLIHIVGDPLIPGDDIEARMYTEAQYQAWDMISGRMAPELGGRPEYLDIVGVNYYERNQWVHNSTPLQRDDTRYKPFSQLLDEVWRRYRRPIFVSETGTEDDRRAQWFNYVCDEVAAAQARAVSVHGICLYPILNHPGWEDDRHCHNGLFDYADTDGHREIYWPLAQALLNHQSKFARSKQVNNDTQERRPDLSVSSSLGVRVPASPTSNEPLRA